MPRRLTPPPRHFYSQPDLEHHPGDIWRNIPTYGLLRCKQASGIVITPACDLSNRKVETITYLPILCFRKWLCTAAFLPDVIRTLEQELKIADLPLPFDGATVPPPLEAIDELEQAVESLATAERVKSRVKEALLRSSRCCAHLRRMLEPELREADTDCVREFLGDTAWRALTSRVIRNAQRTDLHFLPADGEELEWSALPTHSVVLFRYPITVPIEILDAAQDIGLADWNGALDQLEYAQPLVTAFRDARPVKGLTLRSEHVADMLTRFVSLYSRLGSTDLPAGLVETYAREFGEQP